MIACLRRVLLVQILMLGSGCSFGLSGVKAVTPDSPKPTCTQHYTVPVVDTIAAGGGAYLAGVMFAEGPSEGSDPGDQDFEGPRKAFLISGVVIALVYGAAAVTGYSRVSSCHDANSRYRQRQTLGIPRSTKP